MENEICARVVSILHWSMKQNGFDGGRKENFTKIIVCPDIIMLYFVTGFVLLIDIYLCFHTMSTDFILRVSDGFSDSLK
jgi:hypothetical protein